MYQRGFCLGGEIPGVLAFNSSHQHLPKSETERLIVSSTMGGVTGTKNQQTVDINMTIIDVIHLPIADIKWTYQT